GGERPGDRGGAQPFGAFGQEHRLSGTAAAQPPLQAAVLVPGEQVQVDDLLATGHQAVVQRLHADLADRAERELERLPAAGARRVPLPWGSGRLMPQAREVRARPRRQREPVERLPAGWPYPELLVDLAFLGERGGRDV